MTLIILTGALLSWVINQDAGRIAVASVAAFVIAEAVDTVVFHRLRNQSWMMRANGSNLPSAFIDSLVFPAIAFGGFLPVVVAGQFTAKVAGGFVWAFAIGLWRVRRASVQTVAAP